ncbi:MAG: phosphotransferase family protein [Planctomycetes bacterium]|nr:phosphotransferase family protein [Planctomycetota bacterium]
MDPAIRRILARLPGLDPGKASVTPLSGGITNRNWRVDAPGGPFVLRIGGEGTELLGIDRRNEHAASAIAASLGVGAEVVAFFEDEKALVTRFVEGSALGPEDVRRPEVLARIARAVRRCHDGPPFPGSFSPFETVRAYRARAVEHGVSFPPEAARALDLLARIERALGPPERLVPCHNDLLAANFIDDGRAVRILDWEYAGMGDPSFDLGNLAVNNGLPPEDRERLLELYAGATTPRGLARLELHRLASDMRESFWGFLQSGVSRLEFDFRKYALDHLGRFLENVGARELERWTFERWTSEARA